MVRLGDLIRRGELVRIDRARTDEASKRSLASRRHSSVFVRLSRAVRLVRPAFAQLHALLDAGRERHRRRRLAFLAPVRALGFRTRFAEHQVRYALLLAFGCESRRCPISKLD